MSNEYQIITLEAKAQMITVYEEPDPRIKDLEQIVYKIRELEQMCDKVKAQLSSIRYKAENQITDLMFK
jgi:hypothetical protein